ncbi:TIGR04086 family membrane protein [Pseudarthrobacter sp. BIM B-2242]|uniref:TIGR04086 family membrane protein n=1 Tax=Pseudarthrobacter sp. BIM B-2242 TaxID=2772401 RepID=UPI00168AB5FA|nr:TIGR04086 family membrane protein [Pseudarthrobacter sp. BIM B-2242]QOD03386.1 TIGR04086 family membrane protein [Pseudarthrobacter sp. BIM B-2242]
MSNHMEPGDGLPRRARNDNLRSETARDASFAGGEPTRALDQTNPPRVEQSTVEQPYGARATGDQEPSAERSYRAEPYAAEPAGAAPVIDPRLTDPRLTDRQTAVAREKEQFGGVKVGSAFFGWLAATGMAVLLTAFVAAAGTAVGLANNTDVNEAVNQMATNGTVGVAGIVILLVILFVSYYSGGYVAGRMARFNGAKQGMMVWVWALIAAVVVALLGLLAGQQFNVLANLNSFPRIPVNEGELTVTSIIAAVVVAAVALVGAVLGGLAGMHFHRKVDKAGFTPDETYSEA